MKSKRIAIIIALILLGCVAASVFLYRSRQPKKIARIYRGTTLYAQVDLAKPQSFTVEAANGGSNTVEVRDGKISVTHASCPDQVCVLMGAQDGGIPIACLPNSLMILFAE